MGRPKEAVDQPDNGENTKTGDYGSKATARTWNSIKEHHPLRWLLKRAQEICWQQGISLGNKAAIHVLILNYFW